MAFNIYKWRRDQLLTESSIHPDPKNLYTGELNADQNKQRKQMLQQLLDWEKNSPNPNPESIEYLEGQLGNINETKVSDLTFSKDDLYPTSIAMGSSATIGSKEEFEAWQKKFEKDYGDIELEKGPGGWKPSKSHPAVKQSNATYDKSEFKGD